MTERSYFPYNLAETTSEEQIRKNVIAATTEFIHKMDYGDKLVIERLPKEEQALIFWRLSVEQKDS